MHLHVYTYTQKEHALVYTLSTSLNFGNRIISLLYDMSIPETIYCLHHETNVRMMKEKGSSNHRMLHLILHGMPVSGKT